MVIDGNGNQQPTSYLLIMDNSTDINIDLVIANIE